MSRSLGRLVEPVGMLGDVYALSSSNEAWLAGILRRCESAFDSGEGLYAYLHDARSGGGRGVGEFVQYGAVTRLDALFRDLHDIEPDAMRDLVSTGGSFVGSCSTTPSSGPPEARTVERLGDEGIADSVCILAAADDVALSLGAPTTSMVHLRSKVCRQWTMFAEHISAALRVRRRLAHARPVGAICPSSQTLDGDARLHPFRDLLLDAALLRENAMGHRRRREPGAALFPALVAGRFSLVDQWDSGGRRYVAVIENPPTRQDPRALTTAELRVARGLLVGRSVKELAAALEVGSSTVTTLGSTVYRKLGVRSRSELRVLADADPVAAVNALGTGDPVWLFRVAASLPADVTSNLSSALVDVLGRLLAGSSTREIARARGTTVATVEKQVTRVYRALGIRCRGDLGKLSSRPRSAPRGPIGADMLGE